MNTISRHVQNRHLFQQKTPNDRLSAPVARLRVSVLGITLVKIIPFCQYVGSIPFEWERAFSYFFGGGVLSDPLPASRVWSCPGARYTLPCSSWLHTAQDEHHSSSRTSSIVARSWGSTFSILPIMCLLSRGRMRNSRQGPLITSCLSFCDSE
jgi:hypothetical protein